MLSRRSFAMLLGAAATAGVAACSGNKDTSPQSSGSSTPGNASSSSAPGDSFPVTITHAFGETVIQKKPERIATIAWANHEVPLALGIVPVGMSKATWGDDDGDGLLPWVKDKLTELVAETPVLFDETDSIPFEQVNETKPDVILAAYSGITQEQYDTLSKIAPVVAYPKLAWGTSMNEMIKLNSQAMGMTAEGEKLVSSLKEQVNAALEKHSGLKGKKVLFAFPNAEDLSKIGFYTSHDPRPGFLIEHGLPAPQVVVDESAKTEAFNVEVSAEKPELFEDVDIFLGYGPDDPTDLIAALKANPLTSRIPAIANDRMVFLGNDPLAASANPSPLSIPWGIDKYFAKLAEALK